jgi:molybdopterin molybdotransferase
MAEMIELDDALRRVRGHVLCNEPQERPLAAALGCIVAEDIAAAHDSPPYDKSMVDGYAVVAADFSSGPRRLEVIEEIPAGWVPRRTIGPGQASRIMTGAPLPRGADAVVMLEQTRRGDAGEEHSIEITTAPTVGQHVMPRGSACQTGRLILPRGQKIRPVEVGLLAEAGRATVQVIRPPHVTCIQTGNELVAPGKSLAPGQITNSNGPLLCAMIRQAGGTVDDLGAVADQREPLRAAVERGLAADVLVLSGGVSEGDLDLVPSVLEQAGVERVFHKVQLRPGKPLWFGVHRDEDHSTLVFGLPGNPVSSFVCFRVFVTPALQTMAGRDDQYVWLPNTIRLAREFHVRGPRPTFWPARFQPETDSVSPLDWLGSADPFPLASSDCLILFAKGDRTYAAGESVSVLDLEV